MYRNDSHTPKFPEFGLPFADSLNPNNRWIKKAKMIPWTLVEQEYLKNLSGSTNGSPAKTSRMAFGALVIKEELQLSDRETVEQIQENPYLQYFVGLEDFITKEPFDATMMVAFRKRFPEDSMSRINEAIAMSALKSKKGSSSKHYDSDSNPPTDASNARLPEPAPETKEEPKNQGKLLMDATCAPADIRYPTDLSLLNEAREKTEKIIDQLHRERPLGSQKPRTYRQKARKEFVSVIKKKNKSAKVIRKAIRKQLGYVRRNLNHIQTLVRTVSLNVLKRKPYRDLLVIGEVYRQQKWMYESRQKRIDDRIVSIWFPHVRPIKRGKANADTEFGAKLHVSLVDGLAFMERMDWNNFHEGTDLIRVVESYRRRFGFYPKSVHADKIYRTRDNIAFCRKHGIRLSGPRLGRPPKDEALDREQKKLARQDEIDRIPIEGKFGQGKRRFGWDRIMAKLDSTSETVISLSLLVMNLVKIGRWLNGRGLFLSILSRIVRTFRPFLFPQKVFNTFYADPLKIHKLSSLGFI